MSCNTVISLPNCMKIHIEYVCYADITLLIKSYANVTSVDDTEYIMFSGLEF